jgi:HK97 family phage major capsid protein
MDVADLPRLTDLRAAQATKALPFVRLAKSLILGRGDLLQALQVASSRWPEMPQVATVLRAAVNAGSLSDALRGGTLATMQSIASEFIAALRPLSVVGRLTGVRRAPFQVRFPRTTSSSTVGWVAPGAPKPVSEIHLDETSLGVSRIAGIVVTSTELARSSSPGSEALLRDDLTSSVALFVDQAFLDPSFAAVADKNPASITHGTTPIPSTGITPAAIAADIGSLIAALVSGGSQLLAPLIVMRPSVAVKLSLMRDSAGGVAFPGLGYNGGSIGGVPVMTSSALPSSVSGGSIIVALDQSEILLADDGGVTIDGSTEASLQLDSAPSSSAANQVSLFQNNLAALRAERTINWAPRRASGVAAYIDGVML